MIFIAFLLKNWLAVAMGVVVIALLCFVAALKFDLVVSGHKIAQLKRDIATRDNAIENLQAVIEKQAVEKEP